MKQILAVAFVLLTNNVLGSRLLDRFDNWVNEFNVQIFDDVHRENLIRNWKINDEYIELVNGRNLSYTLAHNHLSGLSSKEYTEFLGFEKFIRTPNSVSSMDTSNYGLPTSVNWVDMGAVTTVKDQGQCGSCWSFSTTGALEGAYFVKYGSLPSFSEQQLVDCDTLRNGGKDHGCNGGLMDNAFSWIEKNNGLCVETDYPYTSGITKTGGTCETTCSVNTKSAVKSIVDVRKSSDNDMMAALSKQPVSIAIEADQKDFQLYSSGVFTGQCGTGLDHGVLAVGYGTLSGQDYYLVKNSWSSSWGDNGYIRLGRGPQFNNGDGQCGMLLEASYPVL